MNKKQIIKQVLNNLRAFKKQLLKGMNFTTELESLDYLINYYEMLRRTEKN